MYKYIILTLFCFVSSFVSANDYETNKTTFVQDFSAIAQKQEIPSVFKKGSNYEISKVPTEFTCFLTEDSRLCLQIDLPKGLKLPFIYRHYKNKNSVGCWIQTNVVDGKNFLDSNGDKLNAYEIFVDVINAQDDLLELSVTEVVKVEKELIDTSTQESKQTRLYQISPIQADTSEYPNFQIFDLSRQSGMVSVDVYLP
jgi:hypothetical protein